ncbi:MAG: arylsulfatase A-like enzyme [Planctomycetota bacterium]|jgi:arylsulfatase A-like enzyme
MNSTPHNEKSPGEPPLGRAWIGPALLMAGLLALARVEILVRLTQESVPIGAEWARWATLADWPALIIEAAIMGAAAVAVVWSARGAKRPVGIFLGALILVSALSGWPIATQELTLKQPVSGLPELWQLTLGCVLLASSLSAFAAWTRRRPAIHSLFSALPVFILIGAASLGIPSWMLWKASQVAPEMPVREVLAQLDPDVKSWNVIEENPDHPAHAAVMTPFVDVRFTKAEHDTGDMTALVMSPPCELNFDIPEDIKVADLLLAAQIDGKYTNRGINLPGRSRPSALDKMELEAISVKFEVLLDGEPIFAESITHTHEDTGLDRAWRRLGENGLLEVKAGQVITLRTEFGDAQTAKAFSKQGLQCGFGGMVLDRWTTKQRVHATINEPNILFITIDTLRADRMSCYGYEKKTTPYMDALAEEGLLFERAYATSSWTWPSTASLFTGLLPYEHGVLSNAACTLNYTYETLAESLQARGYTTAAISCNPLIDSTRQFDQGFEYFDCTSQMRMTDEVIENIEDKLREVSKARFFLYLQLVDPHTPHRPLASELERLGGEKPKDFPDSVQAGIELDGMDVYAGMLTRGEATDKHGNIHPERVVPKAHAEWMSDRYDASIGTGDVYVGRILSLLDELMLRENTIIVITSDHGEELLDHGMLAHGHALWNELVHVPLIIAGPGIPKGESIYQEVSNRHLAATMANVGGADLSNVVDRINLLLPEITNSKVFYQTSKGFWNGHRRLELQGMRDESIVVHSAPDGGPWQKPSNTNGDARIYATESDFAEQTDLMIDPKYRAQAVPILTEIRQSVKNQRKRKKGGDVPIGASALRALQGVGYVGGDEDLESAIEGNSGDSDSNSKGESKKEKQ